MSQMGCEEVHGDLGITQAQLLGLVDEFFDLYRARPVKRNSGGVGINHAFAIYAAAKILDPAVIVESGVWRGQSTWILEQAAPHSRLVCLDPHPERRVYTSGRATYFTDDFAGIDWSKTDVSGALCFFDDHQNAYERLKEMKWWGFQHAIFEDNFPPGEGDSYSLRHVIAGSGHPHIQMSASFRPRGWRRALTSLQEWALHRNYWRQSVIRQPNSIDRSGLARNLVGLQEIPPLAVNESNNWGGPWIGPYALVAEPLFLDEDERSRALARIADVVGDDPDELRRELEYGYVCLVQIR